MRDNFFDNPAYAFLSRPLKNLGGCVKGAFTGMIDEGSYAVAMIGGIGALFGALVGATAIGSMAYTLAGGAGLLAGSAAFAGGLVGIAGGVLAGGAAALASTVAVVGLMATMVGVIAAGVGLVTGTHETINYHRSKPRQRAALPAPAAPVESLYVSFPTNPIIQMAKAREAINVLTAEQKQELLQSLRESFAVPATRAIPTQQESATAPGTKGKVVPVM